MTIKAERRFYSAEVRTYDPEAGDVGDSTQRSVGGYAATFNSPTVIAGCFVEVIRPGAFAAAILRDDVRALFNHDANFVLGRNTAKTLYLGEDDKGLTWRADPPKTQWAADLAVSIDRGDISGCSFQFIPEVEEWDYSGEMPTRTLIELGLIDVSAVTFPAYDDTTLAMRTVSEARARDAAARHSPLSEAEQSRLGRRRSMLDRFTRA